MGKTGIHFFELAANLATSYHHGILDKGGVPYIKHPMRVAEKVKGLNEKIVALLHDTVEDTEMTLDRLRNFYGFPELIVEAVDAMTRRDPESWKKYILRVRDNPIARVVKIADIKDNMDQNRPGADQMTHLLGMYRKGLRLLRPRCPHCGGFEDLHVKITDNFCTLRRERIN